MTNVKIYLAGHHKVGKCSTSIGMNRLKYIHCYLVLRLAFVFVILLLTYVYMIIYDLRLDEMITPTKNRVD